MILAMQFDCLSMVIAFSSSDEIVSFQNQVHSRMSWETRKANVSLSKKLSCCQRTLRNAFSYCMDLEMRGNINHIMNI